jgi:endonuclease/exonuclease/phosphatase family metal-dependent hydrolase
MLQNIETYDVNTAVCIEVESPLGPMIVYGSIITYANDKGPRGKSKRWQEHRKEIREHAKDWMKIRGQYPNHFFVVGGDFNQSRDGPGWYEDPSSVSDLSDALTSANLKSVTQENFQETIGLSRASIDHICLPISFPDECVNADAWEGIIDGQKLSDHNGILVDIAIDNFKR